MQDKERDPAKKEGCEPKTRTGALLQHIRGLHGYDDNRVEFLKWKGVKYSPKTWQRWECGNNIPKTKDLTYMEEIDLVPVADITFDVLHKAMELDKGDKYRKLKGDLITAATLLSLLIISGSFVYFMLVTNTSLISPTPVPTPIKEVCSSVEENNDGSCNYKLDGVWYSWDCSTLADYCSQVPSLGNGTVVPTATKTVIAP